MTTLPSNLDETLFACVSSILDAEALAFDRHDEVLQTISAVVRVTHRAIAAFAERWNTVKPANLPPELLADCFQYLPFNDRLLVSRVSQHWRHVAVSTPLLWTAFSVGKQDGKLEAMLHRTGSAPLSLRVLLTEAEQTALRLHFGRIRELRCSNQPARLDAPLLQTLIVESAHAGGVVLSEDYVGSSARSLRTLHLCGAFSIEPTIPVFANLRELKARFTIKTPLSVVLAQCPSLESLTVWCDRNLGFEPHSLFVPLPPRLVDVYILGILCLTGPTNNTLQPWLGHHFRRLELGRLLDVSGALHLFCASIRPQGSPWFMEIRAEEKASYILRTPKDQLHITGPPFARDTAAATISHIQHFRPHIQHLTALRLSLRFFPLCIGMGLELPAITAFTLVVNPKHDGDSAYAIRQSQHCLVFPLLRTFSLACRPGYAFDRDALHWFFVTLPRNLRIWIRYDTPELDAIDLDGPVLGAALKKVNYEQSALYSLATEILLDASVLE